uniref:Uncharacterized protein n=1 Tax=Arion vulgaris TaxID=1028688 RepID=A0A0B6ZEN7_9EUPU
MIKMAEKNKHKQAANNKNTPHKVMYKLYYFILHVIEHIINLLSSSYPSLFKVLKTHYTHTGSLHKCSSSNYPK